MAVYVVPHQLTMYCSSENVYGRPSCTLLARRLCSADASALSRTHQGFITGSYAR